MEVNPNEESSQEIEIYDFVWAKLPGYQPLPGMVMMPKDDGPARELADDYWVYFFSSHDYAWVEKLNVERYEAKKDFYTAKYKRNYFKRGVKELEELLENIRRDPQHKIHFIQERDEDTINLKRVQRHSRAAKRARAEESEIEESLEYPRLPERFIHIYEENMVKRANMEQNSTSPTRTSPTRTSSTRALPTRTSPTRTSSTRTSPTRTSSTRMSPTRTSSTRTSLTRALPTRTSPTRTSLTRALPTRTSPTSSSSTRTSSTRTSSTRALPTRTSPTRTSPTSSSSTRTSSTRTSSTRTSLTRALPTRTSPTRTSLTRALPTRTSPTSSSSTRTSSTRTSSTRALPTRTSPTRTSPTSSSSTRTSSTRTSSTRTSSTRALPTRTSPTSSSSTRTSSTRTSSTRTSSTRALPTRTSPTRTSSTRSSSTSTSPTRSSPTRSSPSRSSPSRSSPTRTSSTRSSPTRTSPTRTSSTLTSSTHTSSTHTSPTRTSPTRSSPSRSSPTRTSSTRSSPTRTSPTRTSSTLTSSTHTSSTHTSPTRTSPTRSSPSRTSLTRTSPTRSSPSRTSPTRSSPSRTSPTRSSPSRTSPTRSSPSRTSPTRSSPTRSSPSRTSPTRSSPSRTSPTRSSPSRTSPTRTSPVQRPLTSILKIANTSSRRPIRKIFGILAGNIISVGIVKNMLANGLQINLYYASQLKRDEELKKILAEYEDKTEWLNVLATPNELAIKSEIILSCQGSDRECKDTASKFGNSIQDKKYVEMSSIGPDASIELQTMLDVYRVTYMEAMIQGGRHAAMDKKLMLIVCGNQELFDECEPCFKSISELYFFLTNSNAATKCHSILQMLRGVFIGGLSEAIGLARAYGISAEHFNEMFSKTHLYTDYLEEKLKMFLDEDNTEVDEQIQTIQSDLYQGILFSDRVLCPMSIAAPTNEKFKVACAGGLPTEDVSNLFDSF